MLPLHDLLDMADLAAAVGGAGGGHSEAEQQGIFMDFPMVLVMFNECFMDV